MKKKITTLLLVLLMLGLTGCETAAVKEARENLNNTKSAATETYNNKISNINKTYGSFWKQIFTGTRSEAKTETLKAKGEKYLAIKTAQNNYDLTASSENEKIWKIVKIAAIALAVLLLILLILKLFRGSSGKTETVIVQQPSSSLAARGGY